MATHILTVSTTFLHEQEQHKQQLVVGSGIVCQSINQTQGGKMVSKIYNYIGEEYSYTVREIQWWMDGFA